MHKHAPMRKLKFVWPWPTFNLRNSCVQCVRDNGWKAVCLCLSTVTEGSDNGVQCHEPAINLRASLIPLQPVSQVFRSVVVDALAQVVYIEASFAVSFVQQRNDPQNEQTGQPRGFLSRILVLRLLGIVHGRIWHRRMWLFCLFSADETQSAASIDGFSHGTRITRDPTTLHFCPLLQLNFAIRLDECLSALWLRSSILEAIRGFTSRLFSSPRVLIWVAPCCMCRVSFKFTGTAPHKYRVR